MLKKLIPLIFACLLLSLCFSSVSVKATSPQIDRVAVVSRVVDGDTFVLDNGDRVRFADINTPEDGEAGYQQAKDYVVSIVEHKTVYLDIDNLTTTDPYGRLVCVVYFDYNSTQYENLNKALLAENLAVVYDFTNNDFSPTNWSLYVPKSQLAIPEFPIVVLLALAVIPITLLVIKKKAFEKNNML